MSPESPEKASRYAVFMALIFTYYGARSTNFLPLAPQGCEAAEAERERSRGEVIAVAPFDGAGEGRHSARPRAIMEFRLFLYVIPTEAADGGSSAQRFPEGATAKMLVTYPGTVRFRVPRERL